MKHIRTFCITSVLGLCLGLLTRDAVAQQQGGRVLDARTDSPLSGATISNKTTGSGTISEENGRFQLPASKGDTLVISLIGYQPNRSATKARKA